MKMTMNIAAIGVLLGVVSLPAVVGQRAAAPASRAVGAAEAFLATLDQSQRAKGVLPLNEKTRVVWSNLPTGIRMQVGPTVRNGLKLGDLSASQQQAALAAVASVLSPVGYKKVLDIVNADQALEESAGPSRAPNAPVRFGRAEYYIAILGTPAPATRWILQFGGHHLAINVTVAGADSVLTPTHTGAQPATFQLNGETIRPLGRETDKAFTLMNTLDAAQQKQALLGYEVRNLVLGPGEDGKVIQPEGIRGSSLNPKQHEMLLSLMSEWVTILNDGAAAAKMKELQANLPETYFAWAGSTVNGKAAYFRVQGPTVLIEYAPQGANNAPSVDHIHTIYRDPTNDYGPKMRTQ
jgi:hypothetical protein